nr:PREDICTED: trafficking protein particle complex subunit 12 [Bemisia tabaci]
MSNRKSTEDRTGKGAAPSLNQYFENDPVPVYSNIFDQLSNNASAMMSSVIDSSSQNMNREPVVTPDLSTLKLDDQSSLKSKPSEVIASSALNLQKDKSKEEPVICRIFSSSSSDSATSESKNFATGTAFFDMLSSDSPPTPQFEEELPSPAGRESANNPRLMLSTSDFMHPDGSFLGSTSKMSAPFCETDGISDELFITSGSHSTPGGTGEADRRRDAWIPSNRTRLALITAATSPSGIHSSDRDLLTMPGVVLEEDLVDNVGHVVNLCLGENEAMQRKVLTVNDVTQDERGLRELIQAECYKAAINLTGRLLTIYGQGIRGSSHPSKLHTVHSTQLWFTRFTLLVKLQQFSLAWDEAEPWRDLDQPDLYFQFYPELYGGRIGSMVPFSMRLLLAELPQYVKKPEIAMERLHSILAIVRQMLSNLSSNRSEDGSQLELSQNDRMESKKFWAARETRILHSITNCALYQREYSLAIQIVEQLLLKPRFEPSLLVKRSLYSALGRIYLQLGDLAGAEKYFSYSKKIKEIYQKDNPNHQDIRELVDYGLLALANNSLQAAYEHFRKVSIIDPSNIMVLNNIAVCLLNMGRLKEAYKLLEDTVNSNPVLGLNEKVLLNICTLYDLECLNTSKFNLLKLISKYKGDSVNISCLNLGPNI